jgi:hypothetical protein
MHIDLTGRQSCSAVILALVARTPVSVAGERVIVLSQ